MRKALLNLESFEAELSYQTSISRAAQRKLLRAQEQKKTEKVEKKSLAAKEPGLSRIFLSPFSHQNEVVAVLYALGILLLSVVLYMAVYMSSELTPIWEGNLIYLLLGYSCAGFLLYQGFMPLLKITEEGITSSSLFGIRFIPWGAIEKAEWRKNSKQFICTSADLKIDCAAAAQKHPKMFRTLERWSDSQRSLAEEWSLPFELHHKLRMKPLYAVFAVLGFTLMYGAMIYRALKQDDPLEAMGEMLHIFAGSLIPALLGIYTQSLIVTFEQNCVEMGRFFNTKRYPFEQLTEMNVKDKKLILEVEGENPVLKESYYDIPLLDLEYQLRRRYKLPVHSSYDADLESFSEQVELHEQRTHTSVSMMRVFNVIVALLILCWVYGLFAWVF